MWKQSFGVLQRIGRALMLPVALLPAAGLLLAIGTAMQEEQMIELLPFLTSAPAELIAELMSEAGGVVFDNLAVLFAVGVALGLAGDGVAALAALIGFMIINVTMSVLLSVNTDMLEEPGYASVLGIPTLQTGVFGGIIAGILGAVMYQRFYNINLPTYLGFFAGKRFVPIATAVGGLVIGAALTLVWPPIQSGLNSLSLYVTESNQTLSAFIFGVLERSLVPFGLHHIFYSPFWFEFGSYVNEAGETVNGDQRIFFEQMKDGVPFTAGTFMTGKFPFMMFGLPAAALAIYHCARPENKKMVAGIMGSAALTSFLTGITEPLEFSFLFVAPLLFAIHAIFAGFSFMIMQLLDVKIGMTFSGGVIDFLLFGIVPNRTEWWLVIPVGLCFALIYYFGFRFAIQKFNLMTPGREAAAEGAAGMSGAASDEELPREIIAAFGGQENLKHLDACITRLRITVNEKDKVNKDQLKALGASGVMEVGNNVQAIFGPKSDSIKSQMQDVIAGKTPEPIAEKEAAATVMDTASAEDIQAMSITSPATGRLIRIDEVEDEVFSGKMMGDGFAIVPEEGTFHAPADGTITTVFPTKHAVGMQTDEGTEILIHIGLDTVNMKGEGFEVFVTENDKVKQGDILVKADLGKIRQEAASTTTPVVFTNLDKEYTVSVESGKTVRAEEDDIITIK
ncbi:glucose-specific PTS transporter subunit IIBC [Marinococcus luteus]|nr:glucose-specific PTS transporter subunit IIBC [Marinococcus luteus]